jgi:hypothetical protein
MPDKIIELVKIDDHYVPKDYVEWDSNGKKRHERDYEDAYASLPSVSFCHKVNKFKVEFMGPDSGGYDVQHFTWYFDDLVTLHEHLQKGGNIDTHA